MEQQIWQQQIQRQFQIPINIIAVHLLRSSNNQNKSSCIVRIFQTELFFLLYKMPTIQQLIRNRREPAENRTKSPALKACPQRRGVCTKVYVRFVQVKVCIKKKKNFIFFYNVNLTLIYFLLISETHTFHWLKPNCLSVRQKYSPPIFILYYL